MSTDTKIISMMIVVMLIAATVLVILFGVSLYGKYVTCDGTHNKSFLLEEHIKYYGRDHPGWERDALIRKFNTMSPYEVIIDYNAYHCNWTEAQSLEYYRNVSPWAGVK